MSVPKIAKDLGLEMAKTLGPVVIDFAFNYARNKLVNKLNLQEQYLQDHTKKRIGFK